MMPNFNESTPSTVNIEENDKALPIPFEERAESDDENEKPPVLSLNAFESNAGEQKLPVAAALHNLNIQSEEKNAAAADSLLTQFNGLNIQLKTELRLPSDLKDIWIQIKQTKQADEERLSELRYIAKQGSNRTYLSKKQRKTTAIHGENVSHLNPGEYPVITIKETICMLLIDYKETILADLKQKLAQQFPDNSEEYFSVFQLLIPVKLFFGNDRHLDEFVNNTIDALSIEGLKSMEHIPLEFSIVIDNNTISVSLRDFGPGFPQGYFGQSGETQCHYLDRYLQQPIKKSAKSGEDKMGSIGGQGRGVVQAALHVASINEGVMTVSNHLQKGAVVSVTTPINAQLNQNMLLQMAGQELPGLLKATLQGIFKIAETQQKRLTQAIAKLEKSSFWGHTNDSTFVDDFNVTLNALPDDAFDLDNAQEPKIPLKNLGFFGLAFNSQDTQVSPSELCANQENSAEQHIEIEEVSERLETPDALESPINSLA